MLQSSHPDNARCSSPSWTRQENAPVPGVVVVVEDVTRWLTEAEVTVPVKDTPETEEEYVVPVTLLAAVTASALLVISSSVRTASKPVVRRLRREVFSRSSHFSMIERVIAVFATVRAITSSQIVLCCATVKSVSAAPTIEKNSNCF